MPVDSISIHKSQGSMYNKIYLDIKPKADFTNGLIFVGISRVRCSAGVYLKPFILGRYIANNTNTIKPKDECRNIEN